MSLEGVQAKHSHSYANLFVQRIKALDPALAAIAALSVLSAGVTSYATSRCISALSLQELLSEIPRACEVIPYAGLLTFVLFSGAVLTYARQKN